MFWAAQVALARDEDAHIWISLPVALTAKEREELANHVAEKSLDLLLAEGFLILAGLEDPKRLFEK
jgi:hypothetical protein